MGVQAKMGHVRAVVGGRGLWAFPPGRAAAQAASYPSMVVARLSALEFLRTWRLARPAAGGSPQHVNWPLRANSEFAVVKCSCSWCAARPDCALPATALLSTGISASGSPVMSLREKVVALQKANR